MLNAAQCRAARGLLGWGQQQLADAAKIGIVTVRQFENAGAVPRNATVQVITLTLERAGAVFEERDGMVWVGVPASAAVAKASPAQIIAKGADARAKAGVAVDKALAKTDASAGQKADRKRRLTRVSKGMREK